MMMMCLFTLKQKIISSIYLLVLKRLDISTIEEKKGSIETNIEINDEFNIREIVVLLSAINRMCKIEYSLYNIRTLELKYKICSKEIGVLGTEKKIYDTP